MADEPAQDKQPDAQGVPAGESAESPGSAESAATMAEQALGAATEAADAIATEAGGAAPVDLPDFGDGAGGDGESGIGLLGDVNLNVKIELGRTRMMVEDVLRLNADSVIELDKAAGDPVDIFVNDRHVARGEVLVVNENFCVRVSEIIDSSGARAGGDGSEQAGD